MNFFPAHRDAIVKALQCWGVGMLLGLVAFVSIEIAPIYLKSYEFEKATKRLARLAATNLRPPAAIQEDVFEKGRELELPLEGEDVQVNTATKETPVTSFGTLIDGSEQTNAVGEVGIDVSYAVPVRFPGYTLRLRFHFHADERSI